MTSGSIYLRHHNKILMASYGDVHDDEQYLPEFLKELDGKKIELSDDIINNLSGYSPDQIDNFKASLLIAIRDSDYKEDTMIELGNPDEFGEIFTEIMSKAAPFSKQDKEELQWLVDTFPKSYKNFKPSVIPRKQNKEFLDSL